MTAQLLLASASPRRRELIKKLNLPVTIAISPIDEEALQQDFKGPATELGEWTARHKALGALTLPEAQDAYVITADTTVVLKNTVLGKPDNPDHARTLLLSLRDHWHTVVTGVAVARLSANGTPEIQSTSCTTPVLMRPYTEEEVVAYIATGDPLDKAGAYGIQHPEFQPTARINGCYLNVVGLPVCKLVSLLAEFGVRPALQATTTSFCPWSQKCQPTQ